MSGNGLLMQAKEDQATIKTGNTVKKKGNALVGLQKLPIIGEQPKSTREEDHLREMVEFEFYNLEEPGLMHEFSYGCRGNINSFTLMHGCKYIVPRFIAYHLESKGGPIWKWRPDGTGVMHKELIGKNPRFRMSPTFR
jgi:hypothetical protein